MPAAIFDFGGVLIRWDAWALFQNVCDSRAEYDRFVSEGKFFSYLDRADAGESFADLICEVQHPEWAHLMRVYARRHLEAVTGVDSGVVNVIRRLKARGFALYGLTNWSHEMFPATRGLDPVFELFDDIMVSGEERLRKPDAAIFQRAIQRWNLPQQSLFIDDSEANVVAACAAGWRGVVFRSVEDLEEVICTLI